MIEDHWGCWIRLFGILQHLKHLTWAPKGLLVLSREHASQVLVAWGGTVKHTQHVHLQKILSVFYMIQYNSISISIGELPKDYEDGNVPHPRFCCRRGSAQLGAAVVVLPLQF